MVLTRLLSSPFRAGNFLETYLSFEFSGLFSTSTGNAGRGGGARWSGNIPAPCRLQGGEKAEPASERDHVRGIFSFGDVEIQVNRFFDRNSRPIDVSRFFPPDVHPKITSRVMQNWGNFYFIRKTKNK